MEYEDDTLITIQNPHVLDIVTRKKISFAFHCLIILTCLIFLIYSERFFDMKYSSTISLGGGGILGWYFISFLHDFKNQKFKIIFNRDDFSINNGMKTIKTSYNNIFYFENKNSEVFFCIIEDNKIMCHRIYNSCDDVFNLLTQKCPNRNSKMTYKECRNISSKFDSVLKVGITLSLLNLLLLIYLILNHSNTIVSLLICMVGGISIVVLVFSYEYLEKQRIFLNSK